VTAAAAKILAELVENPCFGVFMLFVDVRPTADAGDAQFSPGIATPPVLRTMEVLFAVAAVVEVAVKPSTLLEMEVTVPKK